MIARHDLLDLIESDSESHISFLQRLIRAPSPNPPGDTRDAISEVQEYLQTFDIQTEIIAPKEHAPNIVSTIHSTSSSNPGRSIVLNGHIDQFPVNDDSQWQRDPYSGDVEDNVVHGRSGVDMKAGTAASIIAFTYLSRFRDQLNGRCTLEVVSDEETGGRWGTQHLLEFDPRAKDWRGDCALIGEPSGPGSIRFGEKGTLRMTFTVTAQSAHGAYIHRSEGAIRIAARLIARLLEFEASPGEGMDRDLREYMQQPEIRKITDEIMWKGAADAMLIPTVNIGTIRGGAKINMIPSECVFEAEIRFPIGLETRSIQDRVNKIMRDFPGASYSVHENHSHRPTHSPYEHEIIELLQKNAEEFMGSKPLPICSLGGTDCKHFRSNGVPAYAYGPSPRGMAERDEKVSVEEFLHTVKVHTLTAWDYLQKGDIRS